MSFPPVKWGPIKYDQESSYRSPTLHFLVVGSTGSGKTTLIKQLMASALNEDAWRPDCRALVYDAKRDILPFLFGLGLANHVKIVNPMDARSLAWEMSRDIRTPITARQVATLLVPEQGEGSGSSAFFDQACREILTGVMLALMSVTKPEHRWTLRDVIEGALNAEFRKQLLSVEKTPSGEPFGTMNRIRRSYIDVHAQLASNIESSLSARVGIYEPIAALWHRAEENGFFSIEEWAQTDNQVLVLGNDEAARATIDALNSVLFKRVAECLLSKPEVKPEALKIGRGRSWVILDEVREAGNLDGLRSILNKGRSKGACVVIGIQDIEGLRAEYGREEANEIAGQCNTVAVLRIVNPDTAEWASGLFGQSVQAVASDSINFGGDNTQIGSSNSTDIRPRIPTCKFLDLTPASPEVGLTGFFRAPNIDAQFLENVAEGHKHKIKTFQPWNISWAKVMDGVPAASERPEHAAFVAAEPSNQYLIPHSEEERKNRFAFGASGLVAPNNDPPGPIPKMDADQVLGKYGL